MKLLSDMSVNIIVSIANIMQVLQIIPKLFKFEYKLLIHTASASLHPLKISKFTDIKISS